MILTMTPPPGYNIPTVSMSSRNPRCISQAVLVTPLAMTDFSKNPPVLSMDRAGFFFLLPRVVCADPLLGRRRRSGAKAALQPGRAAGQRRVSLHGIPRPGAGYSVAPCRAAARHLFLFPPDISPLQLLVLFQLLLMAPMETVTRDQPVLIWSILRWHMLPKLGLRGGWQLA